MPDQADGLRRLVRSRTRFDPDDPAPHGGPIGRRADHPTRRCRTVLVTAGKGGVGTSVVALNLAVALGLRGQRVVLVDADLGTADIDLMTGLAPRFDLGDVLAGACSLLEAAVSGPGGIRIVAGAHAARIPSGRLGSVGEPLRAAVAELRDDPAAEVDLLLIDAGSGLRSTTGHLASLADEVLVVTGPEPTALLGTHAALARLGRLPPAPGVCLVVNQARSLVEGRAVAGRVVASARQFQGLVVHPLGTARVDSRVGRAVRAGSPVVGRGWRPWSGRACRDLGRLADAWLERWDRAELVERIEAAGGAAPASLGTRGPRSRVAALVGL